MIPLCIGLAEIFLLAVITRPKLKVEGLLGVLIFFGIAYGLGKFTQMFFTH